MSAAALLLSAVTCLAGNVPEDTSSSSQPAPERPWKRRRFVFGFFPGISFGVSPIPSLDIPFFLGGRLGQRPWALGVELTFSTGLAERYTLGLVTHRYHLTAMHDFGDRGFVSFGAGTASLFTWGLQVYEVEVRVGRRFGKDRCLAGGIARIGYNHGFRETLPMPQLGFFIGFKTL